MKKENLTWPPEPYKGLSFYGPDDILLFAGRDDEIRECARSLSKFEVKTMILQGETGCGKSSFLRAGLIPFLERRGVGYHFMREQGSNGKKALFIRSTDKPLSKIAEAIFEFSTKPLEIPTPIGLQAVNLAGAIASFEKLVDFQQAVEEDFLLLVGSIRELARMLPDTLILVLDQAEEVLTLMHGEAGNVHRDNFFNFLIRIEAENIDVKFVISIRTEYFGRFDEHLSGRHDEDARLRSYMLHELEADALVTAIKRPTLSESLTEVDEVGIAAREIYNFEFAEGVPERIASDLLNTTTRGGVLPVMQIVCERLYNNTKRRSEPNSAWEITLDDYLKFGGMDGPISGYVHDKIRDKCLSVYLSDDVNFRIKVEKHITGIAQECSNWEEVLMLLVRIHADGTVTTDLRAEGELRQKASSLGCIIDFDEMMQYLCADEQRLLRPPITVVQKGTKAEIKCYSLGHDAVGLMLSVLMESRLQRTKFLEQYGNQASRYRKLFGIFTLIYSVVIISTLVAGELHFVSLALSQEFKRAAVIAISLLTIAGIFYTFRKPSLSESKLIRMATAEFSFRYGKHNFVKKIYFQLRSILIRTGFL
jgi:hypothetical protein